MDRHGSAEAIVDVHDDNTGGARGEHSEQRREAGELRAVSHAGRDRDDGAGGETTDHGGERSLHAGDDDERVGLLDRLANGEDSVDTGDPDIVEPLGGDPGHAQGLDRLFGDGSIAGAGGDDADSSWTRDDGGDLDGADASLRGVVQVGEHLADCRCLGRIEPGDHDVLAGPHELGADGRYLLGSLGLTQNDLGQSLAQDAMMVDVSEAEIGEGGVLDLGERVVDGERAVANAKQQCLESGWIHDAHVARGADVVEMAVADGTALGVVLGVLPVRDRWKMPVFVAPLLGFVLGIVFAWSAIGELTAEPGTVWGSRGLQISALFGLLVFAPVAGYFAAFDTDWAFAYLVSARSIPSAIVLSLVILDAVSVPLGFVIGAPHARRRRIGPTLVLAGVPVALVALAVLALSGRLGMAASYDQFHGDFGTRSIAGTALGYALVWMDGVLAVALALTVRELRKLSPGTSRAGSR